MKYYLAPLEGITTFVYRNAYAKYFGGVDQYYTPFFVTLKNRGFSTKELRELSPENNKGLPVIPQIMSNNGEDSVKLIADIAAMGYGEININLGCPSKTVVTKNKGSGFLALPEELDRYLDTVYAKSSIDISIKTRIGKEQPEEFYRLLEIYNKYPVKELTIHPRLQTDYYKNTPNWDMFEVAYKESKNPICYNGDIVDGETYRQLMSRFPELEAVMFGRGIIGNPALVTQLRGVSKLSKETLFGFQQEILENYLPISSGEHNALYKMKEIWCYMLSVFEDGAKCGKRIKKANNVMAYEAAVQELFRNCPLKTE